MALDRPPQPTTTYKLSNNSKGGQPKVENGSDESGELNWKLLEILCLIFAPLRTFEPCNTDVQLSPMPVPTPEDGQAVVLDLGSAEGNKHHGAKVREECLKFLEGGMEGVDSIAFSTLCDNKSIEAKTLRATLPTRVRRCRR
eukprot:c20582_g3_i6.p2 GENE.c20582_g3_i6~~c20582_g3_i6.p2  ORF type:complete len:142 (+),score=26.79 c20582_g3_i6:336-761(+)